MWVIIDGTNWCKSAHGTCDETKKLFSRRIAVLRERFPGCEMVTAWSGRTTFRTTLMHDYGRRSRDSRERCIGAYKQCGELGLPRLCVDGYEAKDCVATAAALANELGEQAVICSADSALYQCIRSDKALLLKKFKHVPGFHSPFWMNSGQLLVSKGCHPEQWVDWRCLVGDKDVSGVEGVGVKAVRVFFEHYESIDKFFADPTPFGGALTDRLVSAIKAKRQRFPLFKKVLTVDLAVELNREWVDTLSFAS